MYIYILTTEAQAQMSLIQRTRSPHQAPVKGRNMVMNIIDFP